MAIAVQDRMNSGRARSLVVPREHGAWGILLVPLVTGAVIGTRSFAGGSYVALFTLAALSLFWLRTPVESCIGAGPLRVQTDAEGRSVLVAMAVLGTIGALSLTTLFVTGHGAGLVALGAVAAVAFVAQALLKKLGRRYYMAAQIIGSIGLTATAPAAYYVATNRLDVTALALWAANWVFAGNQIHFVQMRIHGARLAEGRDKLRHGATFLAGQVVMAVAAIVAWRMHFLPAIAVLAFLPVLLRGFMWFTPGPQPLAVKRLGWTELAYGVTFGLLLIVAFVL